MDMNEEVRRGYTISKEVKKVWAVQLDLAKKLLEVPEIDEETLSRIYEHDEAIKSLYEKK